LHNAADAEDVAHEAMLAFLPSICQTARPLAVPGVAGSNQLPARAGSWAVHPPSRTAGTAWATDLPKPTAEDIAASNEFARRLQKAMEAQKNHGWFYYSPVSMVTG